MSRATRASPGIGYMLTFCNICNHVPPLTVLGHGDCKKKVHAKGSAKGAGARKVRGIATEFAEQCRGTIKEKVHKALDSGCKLTLGVDTFENKSKKRRHYNLLLAWWIDPNWERQSVCLDVRVLCPRTVRRRLTLDSVAYTDSIRHGLQEYAITLDLCVAFIADHAPPLRKALRDMKFGVLGCGCHGYAVAAQACLARGWPQWCVPGG